MGSKKNAKTMMQVARTEYGRWIINPRIIILGVFAIFVYSLVIEPLKEMAVKSEGALNILEPYIAVVNSGVLIMLIPCIFLALMGDFPVIDGLSLFYLGRTGKIKWLLGQVLFLILGILSVIGFVFVCTCLLVLTDCEVGTDWSETVRFYLTRFPNEAGTFHAELLPANLYNQISLLPALLHSTALLALYLVLLGLILLLFRMLKIRMAGLCVCCVLVALGVGTCAVRTNIMWMFPMANTIVWLHYTDVLREPIKPLWQSYLYFAVLIFVLLAVNLFVAKRSDFITGEH